jgi:hypothetical protein
MADAEELLRGLSREQREAVVAPAPLLIVAAAGSGLTIDAIGTELLSQRR